MGVREFLAVWHVLALTAVAASLGSCSAPPTELPYSNQMPENVLSHDQLENAVSAMMARAKTHQRETAKQIETASRALCLF